MTPLPLVAILELYITNQCNLTCSNCNRYNNYDFSGHYDWRSSEQDIMTWGRRINAGLVTIIGGEPMLHPELYQWVVLATKAWPNTPVMIQTNGTIEHPDTNKIRLLKNTGIVASLHQPNMRKALEKKNKFPNGKFIDMIDNTEFMPCAIQDQGTHFTVHDSDPELAFNACGMKLSHTILHGKLFKCPTVAVLPEFAKQYRIDFTKDQFDLLSRYQALDPDCTEQELQNFLNSEYHSIEQCRLCPDNHQLSAVTFDPSRKDRPKIIPINI